MNKSQKESLKGIITLVVVITISFLVGALFENFTTEKSPIKISQRAVNECWQFCSMNGLQGTNYMSANKDYVYCSCANDLTKTIQNYVLE